MNSFSWLEGVDVLIVDDDYDFAKSIEGYLSDYSATVKIITNPAEAILSIENKKPDLVFLDLKMPKISGLDLLPLIKEVDEFLPIIIISGTLDLAEAVETVKSGADDFVSKPILNFDEFGLVIKNVLEKNSLSKEIEDYRNNLENIVELRTEELRNANKQLLEEIQKRKNAEEQLKVGTSNVIKAIEESRKMLSKELHDSIGQKMVFLKLNLELALKNKDDSGRYIETASESVTQISTELSAIVKMLYPQSIDKYSLTDNIESLVESFRKISNLNIKTIIVGEEPALDRQVKLNIYRVFQEALNNITKHSKASSVVLITEFLDNKIRCEISDDGIGLEMNIENRRLTSTGFFSMEERIADLNGNFKIETEINKGVKIIFDLTL
ncbi:MAG TPA: response regulator [Ignavibacteriaceae bacterium]|nr:response regulator [Ignavibacteriaceae bacterium]